jgi:transposase
LPQIHHRHRHLGSDGQRRVLAQQRPHRLLAQRPSVLQQFAQRRLDATLSLLRRQLQQAQILPVGTRALLPL